MVDPSQAGGRCCVRDSRAGRDILADRLPSEAAGKFVEREPNPVGCGQVGGDCVVAAAQVLHERVSGRDDACG